MPDPLTVRLIDQHQTAYPLPGDLQWLDRDSWSPVQQTTEYSLTGALIVEHSVRQAGRPITLQSPDGGGWVTLAQVDALNAALRDPSRAWTLELWGAAYTVAPRYQDGVLETQPIFWSAPPSAEDRRTITLRLLEL